MKIQEKELNLVHQRFVKVLERRLAVKEMNGWTGWDEVKYGDTLRRILKNLVQEEYFDVANLAMFLWHKDGEASK